MIVVTGCAGFIGWKTAFVLLERGESILGIDDMNDYYDPKIKEWRLSTLLNKKNFEFQRLDISRYEPLKEILDRKGIDSIINLAARAGVRASVENPWVYLDANMKGTLNLLEICKDRNIKKFVLASTSSVYGLEEMPFSEDIKTDKPLAQYPATKKGAEVLCYSYHYLYGIDISIPRYFTVYGPAGRPDMSIFQFIKRIDEGMPIKIFGDGKQKRDFTYIDDIVEGTILGLKPLGYEIFNLGNNNSIELSYVIGLIEEFLGKKAKIEYLPRHPADVPATWADIKRAKKLLGWKPKVKIEEGIERTGRWYIENREWLKTIKI